MNDKRLTIEEQLELNTLLSQTTLERLNEVMVQIAYLQNIVCQPYGIDPLKYWPKEYGGKKEDDNETINNKNKSTLSEENAKVLLETISLDEALIFYNKGGYSITSNIVELIITILRKSNSTIYEAKNILERTRRAMDTLKL